MKPIIHNNCQLFTYNLKTFEFGTIDSENVLVEKAFWKGKQFFDYRQKNGNTDLLIVNAMNIKKAAAKMLILIEMRDSK